MSQESSTDSLRYKRIVEELTFISNADELASAAEGDEPNSRFIYDEIFCTLFDDLDIEGFVLHEPNLSGEERAILGRAVGALVTASKELPEHISERDLLKNDNWRLAQTLIQEFLRLTDRGKDYGN